MSCVPFSRVLRGNGRGEFSVSVRRSKCCGLVIFGLSSSFASGDTRTKCRRRDLNPHSFKGNRILNPARLPFRHSGNSGGKDSAVERDLVLAGPKTVERQKLRAGSDWFTKLVFARRLPNHYQRLNLARCGRRLSRCRLHHKTRPPASARLGVCYCVFRSTCSG